MEVDGAGDRRQEEGDCGGRGHHRQGDVVQVAVGANLVRSLHTVMFS